MNNLTTSPNFITDYDILLHKEGNHFRSYEKFGAHLVTLNGVEGTYFSVWAPNAKMVSVIGDFNGWNPKSHPLNARWDESGIWEGFIPGIGSGEVYKYHIVSYNKGYKVDKGDPFGFSWEVSPKTATRVWDLSYQWNDSSWMKDRYKRNALDAPISIYEVHLGSWMRSPEKNNSPLNYRELAPKLINHIKNSGFTHVEFLPVMEHPFYGSWGYQIIGYFAPTSRYGTPQDFMYLIDQLHQNGIGVILDWVPSHFPSDEHGLVYFDGTHLYEHEDPRLGYHPDWNSYIFNYGRNEVHNFLISNALFWFDKYHIDGLRVDAVASMIYLDYSRKDGEWIPNKYGGKENIEAINFLRLLNKTVYKEYSDVQMIAEESTAWPMVSRPLYIGGLGFGMKWNMGWMHDTLLYISKDPVYRKYHHDQITFSIWYTFSENFVLALSHDEVVYGKGSLLSRMPGDDWQKFANLRLLYGLMFMHPGKKHLFMGGEFGQWQEWNHETSLDWHLLNYPTHQGVLRWIHDLNEIYKSESVLHEQDFYPSGFMWTNINDWNQSIIAFFRKSPSKKDIFLVVCNFTPMIRSNYCIEVKEDGFWKEVLNSDANAYGGSGQGNYGGVHTSDSTLSLTIPPLGVIVLKKEP
ncbi:MAG: 1,4-alpha-glucan branching protein GlgB [Endomicrobiales bacterium]|nr:1,4-alpha-glucan branching protein GlgB [Endomicrobiales bacterium]